MDKPLKDWTLEEVVQYCENQGLRCDGCKIITFCDKFFKKDPWDFEFEDGNNAP